jgi:hypothetical protein
MRPIPLKFLGQPLFFAHRSHFPTQFHQSVDVPNTVNVTGDLL